MCVVDYTIKCSKYLARLESSIKKFTRTMCLHLQVQPGATFWWCYAKNTDKNNTAANTLGTPLQPQPHPHVSPRVVPGSGSLEARADAVFGRAHMRMQHIEHNMPGSRSATLPPAQCRCYAGGNVIAFVKPLCSVPSSPTLAAWATCVAKGPPPPPPTPPASLVATGLRVAFMESPVRGLDTLRPQFSWVVPSPTPNQRMLPHEAQEAAEIQVMDSAGAVTWSSGRVVTATPIFVPNASHPLPLQSDHVYVVHVFLFYFFPFFLVPSYFISFKMSLCFRDVFCICVSHTALYVLGVY